ncbi:SDR family NAD(P)-dependent oxidoreductase [Falsiroseomonas sp. HW251]|uniref:SDR family NAD(P)-dependent oxidoreductase n=1 Tax=Falsiroseomonas sp. HW251 TaxID=3390998 RepID=UPI003D3143E9
MGTLNGRTVLLTGASSGVGAVTARTLLAGGASVVAHYFGDAAHDGAMAELAASAAPDRLLAVKGDFSMSSAAGEVWDAAVRWKGHIDVVVLNAAITRFDGGLDDSAEVWADSWSSQWQVNVMAPAWLMRSAVHHFRQCGGGVLITFSSWNAQRGSTSAAQIAYAATKGAITAAAKTIARTGAKDGILSHIIAPGIVRTKMSEDFARLQGGEDRVTATLAMGEWVPPQELADLVAFLAEGRCRHLSGATLDVNGATYVR